MAVAVESMLKHLAARDEARRARASARLRRIEPLLPRAREIVEAAGGREVQVFGSLARGDFHEASDVDLAVRELPRARYFEVVSALMALFGRRVGSGLSRGRSGIAARAHRGRGARAVNAGIQRLRAEIASDLGAFEARAGELDGMTLDALLAEPARGSP